MSLKRRTLFALFICFFSSSLVAKSWNDIFKSAGIKKEDVSFQIKYKDQKKKNIEWQVDKERIPASLTKIVSVAAAMDSLPLGFKWTSELRSSGLVQKNTLKGDLCFYGGGNPSFITENLVILIDDFKRNEIDKIQGDLIVDETYFDSSYYDSSRQQERVIRAYDSPVSGASFNWNAINLYVRPSNKAGEKAKVFSSPENSYIHIENKVITDSKKTYIEVDRKTERGIEKFIVSGRIALGQEEKTIYRSVENAALWTGENIRSQLMQRSVSLSGKVKQGQCEKNSRLLAKTDSKDFSLVLRDTMKYSNNFLTEILVKSMAKQFSSKPGSMDLGKEQITKFLQKNAIKPEDLYIESVSGFSRKNSFKVNALVKLLEKMDTDFSRSSEFVSSFPINSVDGTLKNRMKSIPEGWVRAKTGLLNGVVGLAGYAQDREKEPFYFAMIYNGNSVPDWKVREAFDDIIRMHVEGK